VKSPFLGMTEKQIRSRTTTWRKLNGCRLNYRGPRVRTFRRALQIVGVALTHVSVCGSRLQYLRNVTACAVHLPRTLCIGFVPNLSSRELYRFCAKAIQLCRAKAWTAGQHLAVTTTRYQITTMATVSGTMTGLMSPLGIGRHRGSTA
jgi:hypothetical protein